MGRARCLPANVRDLLTASIAGRMFSRLQDTIERSMCAYCLRTPEPLARKVWLIVSLAGSNDPSPSILGAWSTQALAEQERDRLVALDQAKPLYARYIYETEEQPLDEPWRRDA